MKQIFFLTFCFFVLAGCSPKNGGGNASGARGSAFAQSKGFDANMPKAVSYEEMTKMLDLNYEPQEPEPEPARKRLPAESVESAQSKGAGKARREIGEYATEYKIEPENAPKHSGNKEKTAQDLREFFVSDWGPKDEIAAENDRPNFYVKFSEPVRALKALRSSEDPESILKIEPKIAGTCHWWGTDGVAFYASEAISPDVEFTISVEPSLTSQRGRKLGGATSFKTRSSPPQIYQIFPGNDGKREYYYDSDSGVPPEFARDFVLRLNMISSEEELQNLIKVETGGKACNFSAKGIFDDTFAATKFNDSKTKTNTFAVHFEGEPPRDSAVKIDIASPNADKLAWGKSESFLTLQKFRVLKNYWQEFRTEESYKGHEKPFHIRFNQRVDAATLLGGNFSISDSEGKTYALSKENFEFKGESGAHLEIFNVKGLEFGKSYKFSLSEKVKDIYGQSLIPFSDVFEVAKKSAIFHLSDYGTKMLEAKYPHDAAIVHRNAPGDKFGYYVGKVKNPFLNYYKQGYNTEGELRHFSEKEENKTYCDLVNLDEQLENGRGFASVCTEEKSFSNGKYHYDRNQLVVQVTDIGITARIGINRLVAMLRTLSDNKPISDAKVYVYAVDREKDEEFSPSSAIAAGTSDSNGLCVLEFDESQAQKVRQTNWQTPLAIFVQAQDDKATFLPDTHSGWRFGVSSGSFSTALQEKSEVFMFCDRGIYKPGETVSFRGIDKIRKLNKYDSYCGDYKISVFNARGDEIPSAKISGKTTESGGFWGSFEIPKDAPVGRSHLKYERDGAQEYLYFEVQSFTALKFQAEANFAAQDFFAGDTLSASISASYLGGGPLANAAATTNWFKQNVRFSPDLPETKNFVFGNSKLNENKSQVASENLALSPAGKATATCKTEKSSDGKTYSYRLEAEITDISNQRIVAAATKTVHPGKFYIGVHTLQGFPKKKSKIKFPLVFVDCEGKILGKKSVPKKVEYELVSHRWVLTSQNGVSGEVYTRYEHKDFSEKKGVLTVKGSPVLEIAPENSGEYEIIVSAADSDGNLVRTNYEFYVTGGGFWYSGEYETSLELTADKNMYAPGEFAQVLLKSPLPKGDYMITIEREGILAQEVKHFDEPCSVFEVPIAREFCPVAYLSVCSYSEREKDPSQNFGEPDLNKPKGYYGVTPILINPYIKAFSIDIKTDKTIYRPGEEATVTLRATKGGKPLANAELTAMAVDRAILDIVNYHVPNPIQFFYNPQKFPLCVQGGDSRNILMDPVTFAVKNLQGGDALAESAEEKEAERKDFRPTAFFEPALFTDENGEAVCRFKVPDSLTTFRLTVFGAQDDIFALQEDEFGVRNPVNVQTVQARRLRERDTAECGVLITNLDENPHDVAVSLEIRPIDGDAFIDGKSESQVNVAPGGSQVLYFDIAAKKEGQVELVYHVKSDILTERVVSPILIERPFVPETVVLTGETDGKARHDIEIPSFAYRGGISFTLDATRLGLLRSSLEYLRDFPYDSFERQISWLSSRVLFEKYANSLDFDFAKFAQKDAKAQVAEFFENAKARQHDDGGFDFWNDRPERASSSYISARVADLYSICRREGYSEKELKIDIAALLSFLEKCDDGRDDSQTAYRYFVLAQFEKVSAAKLNALYEKAEGKNLAAMAQIGLAKLELGLSAESEVRGVKKCLQKTQRGVSVNIPEKDIFYSAFSTKIDEAALIAHLIVKANPKDNFVSGLYRSLSESQRRGYWQSTATTARVLRSFRELVNAGNLEKLSVTASVKMDGDEILGGKFVGVGAKPVSQEFDFAGEKLKAQKRDAEIPFSIEAKGKGTLYYSAQMRYAIPSEQQDSADEGFFVEASIKDAQTGEFLEPKGRLFSLESGKIYTFRVNFDTNTDREQVALRVSVPSGAEILNAAFATESDDAGQIKEEREESGWTLWYNRNRMSHCEIYDNEAQFFWDVFRKGASSVEFNFRATRAGIFPTPPVLAECQYESEVFGRTTGWIFEIK